MKKLILTGVDSEITKIIRENRLRINRGLVKFTDESESSVEVTDESEEKKSTRGKGRIPKDSKKIKLDGKPNIEL